MSEAATRTQYVPHTEDLPLVDPAGSGGLTEVFRRRYLLTLITRRELSARYMGSFFGFLWSYIQPAIRFCLYFFLVGIVFDRGMENFGIHLFAGMVLVNYFTTTFTSATQSIVANKRLVQKLAMPLELFPVSAMLVSLYHVIPQLGILIVACLAVGWSPDLMGLVAGVMGIIIIMLLGTAVGLIFSALNVYYRDFGKIVGTLVNMVHFAVPMMYGYELIDKRFGELGGAIYLWNPLAEAVLLFQRCFWATTLANPEQATQIHFPPFLYSRGLIHIVVCVGLLWLAQVLFSRLEKRIPERLSN